jgi:hypothetical protein
MNPLYLCIVVYVLAVFVIFWAAARRGYCERCHHHLNKCECCQHDDCWPTRWTQDGWVKICKRCAEFIYLGDDFNDRPDDAAKYEPYRKD